MWIFADGRVFRFSRFCIALVGLFANFAIGITKRYFDIIFLRAFARFALYYKSAKFEYPKANDEWMPVLKRISVSSVCLFYMSTVDYSMIVSARISCCVLGKGLC